VHAQPRPERLAACAPCHGPGGQTALPGTPSLAAQPKLFIENQLVIIREGLRDVPVMKPLLAGMADEEIVTLATYYAAQPAKTLTPAPRSRNACCAAVAICPPMPANSRCRAWPVRTRPICCRR
jgi:cytochrome c553